MQGAPESYPAHKRVLAVLASVAEKLPDAPLYYNLHDVCKTVHCTPPPMDILRSAIANAGSWRQHKPPLLPRLPCLCTMAHVARPS